MYGMAYKVSGDVHYQWTAVAQFHKPFIDGTTKHDMMWARASDWMDDLDPIQIGSGNFISFKGRRLTDLPAYEAVAWVAYAPPGYVGYQGSQWKTGNIPAAELVLTDFDAYNIDALYPGAYGRVIGIYPSPSWSEELLRSGFLDETQSGLYGDSIVGTTMQGVCWIVGHQGRMVGVSRVASAFGVPVGGVQYRIIGESVHYSPIQDFFATLGFGCYELALFGEEKPDRTGAMASITADEIIFIKDRGGAVMVRGDLDNPTVIQLPYVESTHGARNIPCSTPMGLVYGTRNGVYLWEGGDTTKHLSPQIDGWFWNHADLEYLAQRGRFAWWNPWVVAPNNFVFDTRTQAWWRIDSTDATGVSMNAADVSNETNRLYAFPHKLSDDNNTMWWTATPDVLADTYSWKSQPLFQSRKRMLTVQELHLTITPGSATPCEVMVTLSGFDPDGRVVTPVEITFQTTGNRNTQMLHKDVAPNFQALNIQVRIQASANNTNMPAPKIQAVGIVVGQRARLGKSA
jgi:hypothetical protein